MLNISGRTLGFRPLFFGNALVLMIFEDFCSKNLFLPLIPRPRVFSMGLALIPSEDLGGLPLRFFSKKAILGGRPLRAGGAGTGFVAIETFEFVGVYFTEAEINGRGV
jgi:hypothetical protein